MNWEFIQRLMKCFPRSFINQEGEFIAHKDANQYFVLKNCKDELEVKCKVLEWFSRGAYETDPYRTKQKNDEFHKFMLDGINEFLGTDFDTMDIEQIYTYLGCACDHERTIVFIESGYVMSVLTSEVADSE